MAGEENIDNIINGKIYIHKLAQSMDSTLGISIEKYYKFILLIYGVFFFVRNKLENKMSRINNRNSQKRVN